MIALSIVRLLVDNGAGIHGRDRKNRTPLHLGALKSPDGAALEFLLDNGANIEARDANNETPLHYAMRNQISSLRVTRLLIDKGADIKARSTRGRTPLLTAFATFVRGMLHFKGQAKTVKFRL